MKYAKVSNGLETKVKRKEVIHLKPKDWDIYPMVKRGITADHAYYDGGGKQCSYVTVSSFSF